MNCGKGRLNILVLVGIIVLAACSPIAETRTDDFGLYYYWNTGALPPEYYYQYEIEIGPDGSGVLTYQKGYEENEEQSKVFSFQVDVEQWDEFYSWLQTNRILRSNWKESEDVVVGGSTTSVKLQAAGLKYIIPSVSVLSQRERTTFYELEEQIEKLVPAEIWEQIK